MASEAFYAFVQVHAELNRHWASGDKMSESVELNYAHRLAHYSLKMTEREMQTASQIVNLIDAVDDVVKGMTLTRQGGRRE